MPSFCEYRNCHNLASSTFLGYCNEQHMNRGLKDDPDWFSKAEKTGLFQHFVLKDLQKPPKPEKEVAKLQVRPLQSDDKK